MSQTDSHRPSRSDPHEVQKSMVALRALIGISFAQRPPCHEEPTEILVMRVQGLMKCGHYDLAETLLKDMLSMDPCSRFAISELITLYSHKRSLDAAEAVFDYAHSRDLAGDGIHLAMISAYCRVGKKEPALMVFEMAVARGLLCPKSCKAVFYSSINSQDADSALSILEKSAAAGFADSSMLSAAVSLCVRERGPEKAEEVFRSHEALANMPAYASLVRGYGSRGNPKNAAALCEEAVSKGMADAELVEYAVRLTDSSGFPSVSYDLYQKAVLLGIADERLHKTVIGICGEYGKPVRVRIIMESLIGKDEDTPALYHVSVSALAEAGDERWASRILNKGCERGVLGTDDVHHTFGRLYGQKQFRGIIFLSSRLPNGMNQEIPIMLKTADALRKLGQYERSIRMVDGILARPGIAPVQSQKAKAIKAFSLKDSGRKQEALDLLLALRHEAPEDVEYSPRIACGIVFCWRELGFCKRITPILQAALHDALWQYRADAGSNRLHDIDCALGILANRPELEKGGRCAAV